MKTFLMARGKMMSMLALAAMAVLCPAPACGPSAQQMNEEVLIVASAQGPSRLTMTGTTPEFGRYIAFGEVAFAVDEQDELQDGTGVAVVQAEDGDLIVADLAVQLGQDGASEFTFHWRSSVAFSDGAVVETTGRFVDSKPPGLTRRYVCNACCTRICPPPQVGGGCRMICWPCNCRYETEPARRFDDDDDGLSGGA